MSANVEAMVRAGIEAYRAGKKAEARKLLEKAIELDDYNEQAWMWLSAVVETEEEKRTCLENVVVINPDNAEAKRGLKMLGVEGGNSGGSAPASSASDANPFTDTGLQDFGDVDFAADAVDAGGGYDIATSSASAVYQGPETSAGEYDSWVDNLNLGGSGNSSSTRDDSINSAGPLDANNIQDMFGLDDSDDIFGNDPFDNEPLFDDDDTSFKSGPFGGSSSEPDDDFEMETSPPIAKATRQTPSKPITSPGAENISNDRFLGELADADLSGGDFIIGDDDFDDDGQANIDPDELFSFIPDEISATRLPGTKQGVSPVSMIMLVVLVILNFGAIIFIVMGLS